MDHHFHLLVRVLHRPEGFDVPQEAAVACLERALEEESAMLMHRNLEFWRMTKHEAAMEEWRQQQVASMFCLLGLAMHLGFAADSGTIRRPWQARKREHGALAREFQPIPARPMELGFPRRNHALRISRAGAPCSCAVEVHNPLRWETSAGLDRIQAGNL
jgi:hypothetical protein